MRSLHASILLSLTVLAMPAAANAVGSADGRLAELAQSFAQKAAVYRSRSVAKVDSVGGQVSLWAGVRVAKGTARLRSAGLERSAPVRDVGLHVGVTWGALLVSDTDVIVAPEHTPPSNIVPKLSLRGTAFAGLIAGRSYGLDMGGTRPTDSAGYLFGAGWGGILELRHRRVGAATQPRRIRGLVVAEAGEKLAQRVLQNPTSYDLYREIGRSSARSHAWSEINNSSPRRRLRIPRTRSDTVRRCPSDS
jgi:hypothetical protein